MVLRTFETAGPKEEKQTPDLEALGAKAVEPINTEYPFQQSRYESNHSSGWHVSKAVQREVLL